MTGEFDGAAILEEIERFDPARRLKPGVAEKFAENLPVQPHLVEIEGIDLAAEHHPHDVKTILKGKGRMNKKPAQHIQIGHRDSEDPAGFQNSVDFRERTRQFLLIPQMLVNVGGIDFIGGFIGESRQVRAFTDVVHIQAPLDIENLPPLARLDAANMKSEEFGNIGNGL